MFDHFVRLFVPHHSNNHRPRVLHLTSLLSLIGLLVVVQGSVTILRKTAPNVLGFASNISPQEVVSLTNDERAKFNLAPLSMDDRLSDAARRKVADMFTNNYWAHISPNGTKPWSFILAAGYNYLHAGENLARDFSNARTAMDAWMASPTHKDNIVSARYKNIGVAVADGRINGVETTIIVQMFGTPQSFNPQVSAEQVSIVKPVEAVAPQPVLTATPTTTLAPTPPVSTDEKVMIKTETLTVTPTIDAQALSKALSLAFALLVIVVLVIDWLVVWKKNLIRLSGKSWAHITFLLVIVILTIIIKQGLIL